MRVLILPETDAARVAWDDFVRGRPDGHFLQTCGWGAVKSMHGWPAQRVAIIENGHGGRDPFAALADGTARILAGAQILYRRVAGVSLAYTPRGPLVDWHDTRTSAYLLSAIDRLARSHRSIYLKIEPNLPHSAETDALLHLHKFRPSTETVQPIGSILVPLDLPTQDAMLAVMKPKTRYNVRLAQKRGVTVRLARTDDDFARFYALMQATGSRDQFGVHSHAYYHDVWRTFNGYSAPDTPPEASLGACRDVVPPGGQVGLWLAEFEGKVIAAIMVSVVGDEAIYLYGASDDDHRREMPTYLIQWRAMQWARALGARRYDLWGIPDSVVLGGDSREDLDEKNVRDGMWGVYRFKQGFGGAVVRYQGAYDKPYLPPLYRGWMWWQGRQAAKAASSESLTTS